MLQACYYSQLDAVKFVFCVEYIMRLCSVVLVDVISVALNFNLIGALVHQVTNYHVVAKLAGDGSVSHYCKVAFLSHALSSANYTLMMILLLIYAF
jgi:uncharacterized membrane protein YuzA (DUF378 family)